ncbi:hypothetical protein ACETAC_05205 [Aceticella autotrophica]|uniref:Uncharacterized protein n=1 Tax=Aceticella autotrophica TaxID=2755338 RepID=A0A975AXH1_9THEO|nr:hypothetical protein [Aceticella autotrophica]QSZ28244.1 hypothetical protein ACETAC_05205 [Aceticella autotrophica]
MIDIIGMDLYDAIKLLEKNNLKYKIIETRSVYNYTGYQYKVVNVKNINNNEITVIIAKF